MQTKIIEKSIDLHVIRLLSNKDIEKLDDATKQLLVSSMNLLADEIEIIHSMSTEHQNLLKIHDEQAGLTIGISTSCGLDLRSRKEFLNDYRPEYICGLYDENGQLVS